MGATHLTNFLHMNGTSKDISEITDPGIETTVPQTRTSTSESHEEKRVHEYSTSKPVLDAVVKVFSTHCEPNYSLPWQMSKQNYSFSSGFVIEGRRILTNAHSVDHHTVVQVKKRNEDTKFIANVLAVGNECDLSLLTVDDPDFWTGLSPLQFGDLPDLQASVAVVGYPIGGESISVTAGVVSRVEMHMYQHAKLDLLSIQIDAAINPGSSGGPALNTRGEVVGIAFQGLDADETENIGYLVSRNVVSHFLLDYERNGSYTGFCDFGFKWQNLECDTLRRFKNMRKEDSGVLVVNVNTTAPASKVLKKHDIILSIDGLSVSNAGSVPFRDEECILFPYIATQKFCGDYCHMKILREDKYLDVEYELRDRKESMLVPILEERKKPEYFTIAGLVFVTMSEPYLESEFGEAWAFFAPRWVLCAQQQSGKAFDDEEVVILSQILHASINVHYALAVNRRVSSFNGRRVRNLAHLASLVEDCSSEFLEFDLDVRWEVEDHYVTSIVLDRHEAMDASRDILHTHCIPAASSIGQLKSSS